MRFPTEDIDGSTCLPVEVEEGTTCWVTTQVNVTFPLKKMVYYKSFGVKLFELSEIRFELTDDVEDSQFEVKTK